ncbi:acetylcholine receptor subunit beta-like 1 [Physella acuta]|uniref:acetylcholine receptor subunit beta-like 1 n=1 Tax=Physella acuta TaxID=109671 RepID=UPI0027DE42C9|nr:acetylcholine receptor subunit beta-like 1 [Physella acuta]
MGLLRIQSSLIYILIFCHIYHVVTPQTYTNVTSIFNDKINNSGYNPQVRPLVNQSQTIFVDVWFELVSIVEVNDVAQSFTCNGFLLFGWMDELIVWNPYVYGGHTLIHPLPEQIWRPMVLLLNTLDKRELFKDKKSPVFIYNTGGATWAPGSVFPVSCQLTMTNYPFDQQECVINMTALTLTSEEMQFTSTEPTISTSYYTLHGEWDLLAATISTFNLSTRYVKVPGFQLKFTLKRRPIFLIVNIILPVVFLSFLNILVFIIPVESGEKIGYGITVLLALSVFMCIVMGMLPRSSRSMPNVTIYLFILLIISMLTVIDSIVIVYLSHREEVRACIWAIEQYSLY